jgi:D-alanyl-lipoteichoic acid acyltransferase DltB (MBOAT superfamily)
MTAEESEKVRIETVRNVSDYNFPSYLTYCLYAPLYMAGPIITFNSFVSQVYEPPKSYRFRSTMLYGIRLFGALILMEFMMHYCYVVAMSKASAYKSLSALELAYYSYFNLKFIWLKLLIIWRFFRFWALADGIYTTENMKRCMSNNYSAMGFWRDWHRY